MNNANASKTILIVDDEIMLCILISKILEFKNYRTMMTHNGTGALQILDQHAIDLVLLDVMMPGMNGIEVCEQIKKKPSTATIPVIILTASQNPNTRFEAFKAGADQFCQKPFEMDTLLLLIHEQLNNSEMVRN